MFALTQYAARCGLHERAALSLVPRLFRGLLVGDVTLAQVQRAFDAPARVVLEFAVAIQRVDDAPFRLDEAQPDLIAELDDVAMMLTAGLAVLDVRQLLAVKTAQRSQDLLRQVTLLGERLEFGARGCECLMRRLELRGPAGLAFAAAGIGETQPGHDGRHEQPLADQCDQHHDEGEENDERAMRKGRARRGRYR